MPDSQVAVALWFNSANNDEPPIEAGHFLGVHIGGPTRVGRYFHPWLATATGTKSRAAAGPVLTPGKAYDCSIPVVDQWRTYSSFARVDMAETEVKPWDAPTTYSDVRDVR